MHQLNTDLTGAMEWVVAYHTSLETKFLDGLKQVPSWGPEMDRQVQIYLYGLANWPRCNDCWSFESGRYFGKKGLEIQKSRWVTLLPKVAAADEDCRKENVVIRLVDEMVGGF
jgi:Delta6-protoilludene synthase